MAVEQGRRSFFGLAFGGFAALGGVVSLVAMKQTWDPLPSVEAAGFTTVDLSPMKDGELQTIQWRGQPVFILRKAQNMEVNKSREIVIEQSRYIIMLASCTHLGCIPSWSPSTQKFLCACHGGVFNIDGEVVAAPPPRPLDIPPFKVVGTSITLGEEGPEYLKLVQKV